MIRRFAKSLFTQHPALKKRMVRMKILKLLKSMVITLTKKNTFIYNDWFYCEILDTEHYLNGTLFKLDLKHSHKKKDSN